MVVTRKHDIAVNCPSARRSVIPGAVANENAGGGREGLGLASGEAGPRATDTDGRSRLVRVIGVKLGATAFPVI